MSNSFDDMGFEVLPDLVSPAAVSRLLTAMGALQLAPLRGGIRHIDKLVPAVADLAAAAPILSAAQKYLSGQPCLVRAIYFEKSPENNWFVTWHQDRTVAVSEKFGAPGWGPWSRKDGVWHVQPPLQVLEDMVALRVHLDPATVANGCLKLIPGSHNSGILPAGEVAGWASGRASVYCEVPAGGALAMRPHVLHASDKASLPLPRRVLHFEYSSHVLPEGVSWVA